MTTDRAGREHNAEVVPLRAVDAQTEVLLDEGTQPGAAYVDLTGTGGQRKQIIPEHWRTWENARRHVGLILGRRAHWCAYHGVRLPSYAVKAVAFAVVGVLVTGRKVTSWWHIPGTTHLEYQAAADGLLNEHLRLHKQGRETRTARGTIIVLVLAAAVLMVIAEARYAPWVFVPEAVAVFALLVLAGSKGTGKPIASPARIPDQVQPPTPDVIVRAGGGGRAAAVRHRPPRPPGQRGPDRAQLADRLPARTREDLSCPGAGVLRHPRPHCRSVDP